ncbi:hypothetical protein B5M47_01485 [candidate division CPR3 bacterium 4484_211]|uniref:SHSP domain-containing protein n=1 Tax=candidate division CPR3 bacterium 4484_211 TaxID=1968527 RepID=A0A1W9NYW5_UNCC3|nr:MAG: hypothetical protein B5M47_01485 [candidate division CPR3 bacterium 4484_211]
MALIKWDPFREFRPLVRWSSFPFDWLEEDWSSSMAMDVYEEGNNVVVKADLPGFKPEEVDISVTEDSVTIQAERKEEKEEKKKKNYLRQERFYTRCARTVSLPVPVKAEDADAEFTNGTLTLTLPKAKIEKPKKVKVRVGGKK